MAKTSTVDAATVDGSVVSAGLLARDVTSTPATPDVPTLGGATPDLPPLGGATPAGFKMLTY